MNNQLTLRPATVADARSIANRLRAADYLEAERAGIFCINSHLVTAVETGTATWSVIDPEGICQGIGGVQEHEDAPHIAIVWFMATDELVTTHQREFLRRVRPAVDALNVTYDTLFNTVDAENAVHIRWLRWAGFNLSEPIQYPGDTPFHILTRRRP